MVAVDDIILMDEFASQFPSPDENCPVYPLIEITTVATINTDAATTGDADTDSTGSTPLWITGRINLQLITEPVLLWYLTERFFSIFPPIESRLTGNITYRERW